MTPLTRLTAMWAYVGYPGQGTLEDHLALEIGRLIRFVEYQSATGMVAVSKRSGTIKLVGARIAQMTQARKSSRDHYGCTAPR